MSDNDIRWVMPRNRQETFAHYRYRLPTRLAGHGRWNIGAGAGRSGVKRRHLQVHDIKPTAQTVRAVMRVAEEVIAQIKGP